MIFEQFATGGCQSYLAGCAATCAAAVHFVIFTHSHAAISPSTPLCWRASLPIGQASLQSHRH
jgi:hypothetical protein